MRAIVKESSPEWNMVREGSFMRMVYGRTSPQGVAGGNIGREALANNIRKALSPDSREFMLKLFTPDEMKQFMRLEKALRQTVPAAEARNPSKSGYEVSRALQDMFQKFVSFGAFTTGGPVAGVAAEVGQGVVKGFTKTAAAQIGRASCRERVCPYV